MKKDQLESRRPVPRKIVKKALMGGGRWRAELSCGHVMICHSDVDKIDETHLVRCFRCANGGGEGGVLELV